MIAGVALISFLVLIFHPEREAFVQASEYGDEWGFFPNDLTVKCDLYGYTGGVRRPHVLVQTRGYTYALNGAARSSGLYSDARKIMKRDKDGLYTFRGPHDVLRRGLQLCN